MRIGLAADHAGFALKDLISKWLRGAGHEVVDFGNDHFAADDDYPLFVIPLAKALARGEIARGIAVCGSGVGAAVAASKIPGVRASLIHDVFSAHQGVEDDDMNVICLGGHVVGDRLAIELVSAFLEARFSGADRHRRRLAEVAKLEPREGLR